MASMLCESPNNEEDRSPSAHKTRFPFINLDLGMHTLFPSTHPHTVG